HFLLADASGGTATAGHADQLTITAEDAYGNVATGYTGDHDVTFAGGATSPDSTAPTVADRNGTPVAFGSPVTLTFTGGAASAGGGMTLTKASAQSITASATSPSVTTAAALGMTVAADSPAELDLADATGGSLAAGQSDQLTVSAYDAYGNLATGYAGDHD